MARPFRRGNLGRISESAVIFAALIVCAKDLKPPSYTFDYRGESQNRFAWSPRALTALGNPYLTLLSGQDGAAIARSSDPVLREDLPWWERRKALNKLEQEKADAVARWYQNLISKLPDSGFRRRFHSGFYRQARDC